VCEQLPVSKRLYHSTRLTLQRRKVALDIVAVLVYQIDYPPEIRDLFP
jgi:hypothetical protein